LQNAPRDFSGKLSHGRLHIAPRGRKFLGYTFFRYTNFPSGPAPGVLQLRRSLVEQFLAGRFLFGVDLPARLL
jgi:hypothetical protein